METVIVLFNRDLRVHDQPALSAACDDARQVVPVFVLDPAIPVGHRGDFLLDCLADLRSSLRERGADLLVRRGDVVAETMRLAAEVSADAVYTSADVSSLAQRRQRRFEDERIGFRAFPGVTVVPPGELRPTGGDHYRVFTPYWRAWSARELRPLLPPPGRVNLAAGLSPGHLPERAHQAGRRPEGGETAARKRLRAWLLNGLDGYDDGHDDLAGDCTSRLSPYIHFGCVSARELAGAPHEPFVRQLCWRDFYHQVTLAFPAINRRDYRPRGSRWRDDEQAVRAWKEGTTGVPIVDAGMRQLLAENWMHNRARLITASYLVKHLGIDWRVGAEHFFDLLLDADVANNSGNWQWVAGTGNDTRPNRVFNPTRQAGRFDRGGAYVRRYVPELADMPDEFVHEPWHAPSPPSGYPAPLTTSPGVDAHR